jgi:membrane protein involved in D-alanine export
LFIFYFFETALVLLYFQLRKKIQSRPLLWLFVALAIAPLVIAKLGALVPHLDFIHLLGISYMTFRAVQVLIETYDGLVTEIGLLDFSYFLLFFPSISSGPIDRFRRFRADLENIPGREKYVDLLKAGVWKLMWGALFNFVISSLIYTNWISKLPGNGLIPTISYMYAYTFFLFFNFAGYSLMAIGASYILAIKTPENFNMPFLSRDMKDFWSRWHISLSTWLRDYVYTRFVAAALKGEWYKDRRTASYIGYIITMMTMGLWHGLALRYIVYGAYHGLWMCVNDILDTRWKRFRKLKRADLPSILLIIITFHLFSFGLLIFSGRLI